jgi:hypothetical protein
MAFHPAVPFYKKSTNELISKQLNDLSQDVTVDRMLAFRPIYKQKTGMCFLSTSKKGKVIPLHTMEALGVRGGIAPTHS